MSEATTAMDEIATRMVRVMLIEDSDVIREALIDALSAIDYIVFAATAATAEEAVSKLKQQSFDLLVVDLELRVGTGFEVLRYLAQNHAGEALAPVRVVLTNHAFPIYEQRARALGVDYFFDKSLHFDQAIQTIETEAERLRHIA
ncbi:response regulator [Chitiniphilus purpureus]|uniref:Response regulator n=1 Tax=Chitiniphilus purpureus TaxID=2981137 RepID=A0ABY6DMF5_9NEIS|nr:response regulator [Chitiniphilus sp. CD1]UXY15393.1 response regulator [Chitiniphilus sp. CD1]